MRPAPRTRTEDADGLRASLHSPCRCDVASWCVLEPVAEQDFGHDLAFIGFAAEANRVEVGLEARAYGTRERELARDRLGTGRYRYRPLEAQERPVRRAEQLRERRVAE